MQFRIEGENTRKMNPKFVSKKSKFYIIEITSANENCIDLPQIRESKIQRLASNNCPLTC